MADIASLGIRVTTQGVQQAATDLARLSKQAGTAERASTSLGLSLAKAFTALGGGYLIGRGIGAIINATIDAEKAQAQLAAVLKSTGGAAGLSADQLNKMAASLQAVTTFDDEAITGAQSLLLTFTKIGRDVFPQATETVLNMSQALGQDLKSSAVQLGKALNDPIQGVTALQRVGVSFTDTQKDLIKSLVETGRQSEAQKLILAELETEFGNSARAARDTLGGALQGLKNDFENLLEGDSGGDGIRGTTQAVNRLGEVMRSPQVREGFATIIQLLAVATEKAVLATTAFLNLAQGVDAFGRSEAEAKYNADLAREAQLTERINALKKEGAKFTSPFEPGGVRSINSLEAERAAVAKLNAAYRDRPKPGANPLAPGQEIFAKDGRIVIHHDEELWKTGKSQASAAAKAARDAARAQAEALEELQRKVKETAEANAQFKTGLEDIEAELAGPLAQALLEHNRALAELDDLAKKGEVSSTELARAKEAETERYEREKTAIEERLDVGGRLLRDLQFELDLLTMTNAERATAIQLRGMDAEAVQKYGDQIAQLNLELENNRKVQGALDEFRANFADSVTDVLTGTKSIGDAFKDMVDSLVEQMARIVAQRLSDSLFGAPGQLGGGSAGGWLSSFFGSLFGGGRAAGGPVSGSRLYEVGERGAPELFTAGGRSYLIPGNDGRVTPLGGTSGGDINVSVTINGEVSRKTSLQFANDVARKVREAQR